MVNGTTATERVRQQSLLPSIRGLPPEEVQARQNLLAGQTRTSGSGAGRISSATQQAQQEAQRKAAEARIKAQTQKARIDLISKLNVARNQAITQARQQFSSQIRTIQGVQQKLQARQALQSNIKGIQSETNLQKSNLQSQNLEQLQKQKELPFEKLIRVIPETAGKIAKRGAELSPLRFTDVVIPRTEVPLRQTISTDPTGRFFLEGSKQKFPEAFGESTQQITAIGQFAIPFLGQALFLGSLVEKPVLAPERFKEEFQKNPTQTVVLNALGLISVTGGIKGALSKAQQKAFKAELKTAKIKFLAEADDKTINILAGTKIRGKTFLTRSEIKTLKKEGRETITRGTDVQISIPKKKRVEVLIRQTFAKTKTLEGATARKVVPIGKEFSIKGLPKGAKVSFIKDIKGTPFTSFGVSADRLKAVFNTKKGFNIKNNRIVFLGKQIESQIANPSLIKNNVVGVVSPTEVEGLFKVLAGSQRLRIYKSGGISFVFDPRIEGWLRIKPSGAFSGEGKTILIKTIQAQVAPIQAGVKAQVTKEITRLGVVAKTAKKVSKVSTTIGGNPTLKTIQATKPAVAIPSPASLKTTLTTKPKTKEALASGVTTAQTTAQRQQQQLKARAKTKQTQIPLSISGTQQQQQQQQKLKQLLKTKQLQKTKQLSEAKTRIGIGIGLPLPRTRPRLPRIPFGRSITPKGKPFKKTVSKEAGFNTFVKSKGKFKQSNKVPLKKNSAFSLGSFLTDQTLSASYKVKKAGKPAQKSKLRFPPRYFQGTLRKFRPQKRGNAIVEKRKFRLDTIREKKQIKLAKLLKQIRR